MRRLNVHPVELWGGIECTVNRVGDTWHHQLELSGHTHRVEDLDLIAGLGIRTLRYPVLWESTAPIAVTDCDWQWADARLGRLRDLAIAPIVGLVHHGSGPCYTNLLDDSFAPALAEFAGLVAARFPWVDSFTPVNEPLTTARFSGLYGHWFPHGRDERCFARAFINQCRATVLAMQAIRRSNPGAKLVQTEDLGTTHSTGHMQYQRDFDNERRWLTWDLLCGRVDRNHPLYEFLTGSGILADSLAWFTDNPCPPDIIGVNHYVTSDRFLDERVGQYAPGVLGGNCKESYADVEAVRVLSGDYDGFRVLRDAWERYELPVAATEVHLGCSREEQLRWLNSAWRAAKEASEAGCDVRAVTSWALFGAFNWDTLLTGTGAYEPGAFDVRGPLPRPTAIAAIIRQLTAAGKAAGPVHRGRGWWQRPAKILYGNVNGADGASQEEGGAAAPVLICGATGSLGQALVRACVERNLSYQAVGRVALDICDPDATARIMARLKPWAVINAAGFVDVDGAEQQMAECFRQNTTGAVVLMEAARDRDIPLVTFSSDLVFDGTRAVPYVESSRTGPLNVYGRSKEAAEKVALQYQKTLCVRTAAFFGCWGRGDFALNALRTLAAGRRFYAASDVVVSPTYVPDLASACLDLLIDEEHGIFHLANLGAVSWANWGRMAAEAADIDCRNLQPRRLRDMNWTAPRPRYSALRSERAVLMPTLESALHRFAGMASVTQVSHGENRKYGMAGE